MLKVLVIDDFNEHLDTLTSTLRMYGCEVCGSTSGKDGLQIALKWRPNLIICDDLLDGSNTVMPAWKVAFEFLNVVHSLHEFNGTDIHRPYMVCLTGYANTRGRRLSEEFGFDEYVKKPIELAALLGWVDKARKLIGFEPPSEYKKEEAESGEELS